MSDQTIAFQHNGMFFAVGYQSMLDGLPYGPLDQDQTKFKAKLLNCKPDASGNQQRWILAYHRCLKKWIVMDKDPSKYGRSLRKFRKKLRFNLAAGIFVPNLFVSMTLAPHHYEEIIHPENYMRRGKMISHRSKAGDLNVSSWIRDFFQKLRKEGLDFKYAWRVECGTQSTRRPHVHMLLQLPDGYQPKINRHFQWNKRKKKSECHEQWDLVEKYWPAGDVSDAKILQQDDKSFRMVTNYISKYFSKNSKDGEPEPDPKIWTGQRYNTSRDLIKPPPSCFNKPEETVNAERVTEIEVENAKEQAEIDKLPEEKRNAIYEARKLKWMHASYWFEGDLPGTQMRDYIFNKQQAMQVRLEDRKSETMENSLFFAFAVKKSDPPAAVTFDELWDQYQQNFKLDGPSP